MNAGDGVQIGVGVVLALTLLAVVGYTIQTGRLASATKKMAEEMLETRHGAMLPVLDFVREHTRGVEEAIPGMLRVMQGQFPDTLHVRLKNIGVGPALDLEFQTKLHDGAPNSQQVGHVGVGEFARAELVPTEAWHLYIEPLGDSIKRLSVEYRDVYGRTYRSLRDVTFDRTTGNTTVGPLHTEAESQE